jgi:hypothetical protein
MYASTSSEFFKINVLYFDSLSCGPYMMVGSNSQIATSLFDGAHEVFIEPKSSFS